MVFFGNGLSSPSVLTKNSYVLNSNDLNLMKSSGVPYFGNRVEGGLTGDFWHLTNSNHTKCK